MARDNVFVHDCHADGRKAIGKDGNGRAVLDLGKRRGKRLLRLVPRGSNRDEGLLLLAIARVGHANSIVVRFLVRHGCN